MRVGVDYLAAASHWPGVGRYVRELVRALVRLPDRPDLALYEVGRAPRVVAPRALGLTIGDPRVQRLQVERSRTLVHAVNVLARRGVDDELGGLDLFQHASLWPEHLRVRRAREAVAVAELPSEGTPQDSLLAARLARMHGVLTFSNALRSTLIQRYRLEPAQVVFTPVGCEHWRRTLAELPPKDDPPRILVLGAVRAERRPLVVLRAFERLVERGLDAQLDFACPPPPRGRALDPGAAALYDALRTSPVADKVLWEGRVGARARPALDPAGFEGSLPDRVARASVLLHLSADEGTPVTPLEALALGVPVVASRLPAFVEALGDAAVLVEDAACVREPDYLAEILITALNERNDGPNAARRELVARAFTWERCAEATARAWRKLGSA
ncbi:MAG: glycosyltransferase [Planctomycetes bacterium]|nr:glycosyltransferase [Planctomycetota bacterium]